VWYVLWLIALAADLDSHGSWQQVGDSSSIHLMWQGPSVHIMQIIRLLQHCSIHYQQRMLSILTDLEADQERRQAVMAPYLYAVRRQVAVLI